MTISQYFQNEFQYALGDVVKDVTPERQIISGLPGALANDTNALANNLVPFNTTTPFYENNFYYDIITSSGIAEFYTLSADDIPQVSSGKQRVYGKVEMITLGDSWDYYELQRAQAYGLDTISEAMTLVKRGHDIKLENTAWYGNTSVNLPGFSNFPGVNSALLPADGTGGLTTFASKTPAQMYRDLITIGLSTSANTKNTFMASAIIMSLREYNLISTTRMSSTGDSGDTVLETYMRTQEKNPFGTKRIIPSPYLDGKGVLPNTGMAIVYHYDPKYLQTFVPDYFRTFNSVSDSVGGEMSNFKASFTAVSRTGGTVVKQPLSMQYYTAL